MGERISFDEMFMNVAREVARRSHCLRSQVGAVLVRDRRIIATGYNGVESGADECVTCPRIDGDLPHNIGYADNCPAIHGEENCILQCAIVGVSAVGASLFITRQPCVFCMKRIRQVGISEVVYLDDGGMVVMQL